MAKWLFNVLNNDETPQWVKRSVAEQVFVFWSEFDGKFMEKPKKTHDIKYKLPNEYEGQSINIRSSSGYWSRAALECVKNFDNSKDTKLELHFEHIVPRGILRRCLGINGDIDLPDHYPKKFKSEDDLYNFLERYCVGVVITKDEQGCLDKKDDGGCGLRDVMEYLDEAKQREKHLMWSEWQHDSKTPDPWHRYAILRRTMVQKNMPDLIIYDLINDKTVLFG